MKPRETEAIVLRRFDFSESSQVAHLLTPEEGRISVLARGIKRPNASLKGPMDLFQYAHVRYLRRKGMDLLVKYRPITGFSPVRQDLPTLMSAFYLTEATWSLAREHAPEPLLFRILGRALSALALTQPTPAARPGLVVAAELALLKASGFSLTLNACAGCGKEGAADSILFPQAGGYLCIPCRRDQVFAQTLTAGAREALARLASDEADRARLVRLSRSQEEELRRLLDQVMVGVTERKLRSARFLRMEGVSRPLAPSRSSRASSAAKEPRP